MSKKTDEKKAKKMFEAHIVTLGDGQVGKTSIILRYIENSFSLNYLSTIGIDSKIKKVKLSNGEEVKVKISDTAGQERFKSIASNYMKKANGILLVYDITNPKSFEDINNWFSEIKQDDNPKPIILIGNKSDMSDRRQVSTEDGKNLAKNSGGAGNDIHFYETSCKTGDNIEEAIMDLVNQIYNKFSGNDISNDNIKIDEKEAGKNNKGKKKCC